MLRLPSRIEAVLQDTDGKPLEVAEVLIGLNVLHEGRYYYGNLIGLTDQTGRQSLLRSELDLRFASDRVSYPMDLRIDLEQCDPLIELVLLSEDEVEQARDSASVLSADIRELYARATNRFFAPALTRIWADAPDSDKVVGVLATRSNL